MLIKDIHHTTYKACQKYGIDIAQYDSITTIRLAIAEVRYTKQKEEWREYHKEKMGERYKSNPKKYAEMKKMSRENLKSKDPDYKRRVQLSARKYYYVSRGKELPTHLQEEIETLSNRTTKRPIKHIEKFRVLELPLIQEENEYEIVD